MGNRAVIKSIGSKIGIYLHWNGGRASIEGFLKFCELKGFRSPKTDCYGWARLTQVIANFFGGDGLSVGIDVAENLDCDNYDNGVYIIDGWNIVGREDFKGKEQNDYPIAEMLKSINAAQPVQMKLPEEQFAKIPKGNENQAN